jgi:hypothetical protein
MKKAFEGLFIIWAFLLTACTTKGTSWDIDAYAPVAETTLDLTKLIGDENIQTNGDSSLWLNIDANAYEFSIDSLSNFPSFSAPFSYVWIYPTINISGGAVLRA